MRVERPSQSRNAIQQRTPLRPRRLHHQTFVSLLSQSIQAARRHRGTIGIGLSERSAWQGPPRISTGVRLALCCVRVPSFFLSLHFRGDQPRAKQASNVLAPQLRVWVSPPRRVARAHSYQARFAQRTPTRVTAQRRHHHTHHLGTQGTTQWRRKRTRRLHCLHFWVGRTVGTWAPRNSQKSAKGSRTKTPSTRSRPEPASFPHRRPKFPQWLQPPVKDSAAILLVPRGCTRLNDVVSSALSP